MKFLEKEPLLPLPLNPDAPLFVPPFIVIAAPQPNAMEDSKKNINSVHAKKNKCL
jgi:hypothetical protein